MLQGAYAVKRIRKLLSFFKILLLGWSWTNEFGGGSGLLSWNLPAFVGQLHPDDLICLRCFVDRGPDGVDAQLPRNWADLFDTEALRRSLAPTGQGNRIWIFPTPIGGRKVDSDGIDQLLDGEIRFLESNVRAN